MKATRSGAPGGPDVPLAALLRAAAAELDAQPVPALRPATLDALSAGPAPAPRRRRFGWPALPQALLGPALGTAAVAFGLMLVAGTALVLMAPRDIERSAGDASLLLQAAGPGFVAVAPQERWLRLRDEGGAAWVVNTELPQQGLAAMGLPFDPRHAADPVRAELLMRASGEVLAVRVLR
jgi:hypothetical protein